MRTDALAVVLVTHESADAVGATLAALHPQLREDDEVVVVDNASGDGTADVVRAVAPWATVVETGANLGFGAGCRAGAQASRAPLLFFLNPDATPGAGCLDALRAAAADHPRWGAWQALVTMDGGRAVNTAGNLVHWLGFGFAGRIGVPVQAIDPRPAEIAFASGAALVVRRAAWDAVGGFEDRFFMYVEDQDLSLRLRLAGWEIGLVPAAVVDHDYDFEKGDYKWFYLERNRWWTIVGDYPGGLLALLAPALLLFEVVLLAFAWRGGWLAAKLRAQRAVLGELGPMLARRRAVQRTRAVTARAFAASTLTTSLDSPYLAGAQAVPGADRLQAAYFHVVCALVR